MKTLFLRVFAGLFLTLTGWAAIENTCLLRTTISRVPLRIPRLLLVSDLHRRRFGKGQKRLLAAIRRAAPEYILLTGDLISRDQRDLSAAEALLRSMTEIAPVLYVSGNHEADLPADIRTKLKAILRRQHITDLDDRRTTRGGVTFAGLALPSEYYRGGGALGFRGAKRCTAKTLRQHLGACEPNTILLAHDPLQFPAYAEWGAMLTVSGHVHGGAVRLPWLGGLLSPERKFFPRYSKGSYTQDGRHLVVSGGLGKLRLFNPPEIRIIEGIIEN